jgi:hypothetical protein
VTDTVVILVEIPTSSSSRTSISEPIPQLNGVSNQ